MAKTVTDNPNRTLRLTGAQCRKVASFCCDKAHSKPEHAEWLKLCAKTFLDASEGIRDADECDVPGKLASFLKLWNWLYANAKVSDIAVAISVQMGKEAY